MDEKEFKALEQVYTIRLEKVEKVLIEKRRILKEKEQETQARKQTLHEEEEAYQAIDDEIKNLIGNPIRPSEIEIWRSRQARQKHAISQAHTQLKEAKSQESEARAAVAKQSKLYQEKTLRRDNFHDTLWGIIQEDKRKQEERQEEQDLVYRLPVKEDMDKNQHLL